jgi:hypothetical protein
LGSGLSLAELVMTPSAQLERRLARPVQNPTFRRRRRHSSSHLQSRVQRVLDADPEIHSLRKAITTIGIAHASFKRYCPALFVALKDRSQFYQVTRTARALEKLKRRIAANQGHLAQLPISQAVREVGFVKSYAQVRSLLEGISK